MPMQNESIMHSYCEICRDPIWGEGKFHRCKPEFLCRCDELGTDDWRAIRALNAAEAAEDYAEGMDESGEGRPTERRVFVLSPVSGEIKAFQVGYQIAVVYEATEERLALPSFKILGCESCGQATSHKHTAKGYLCPCVWS